MCRGASAATGTISPSSSERSMSSQPSGSTTTISRIRHCQRDSRRKPAAAARDDDPRRRAAELLDDLEAGGPLPGDDRRIVEARHHGRARFVGDPRGDRLPALRPPIVEDDLGALAASPVDLHLRRIGRHDDDRPNAEPPRRNRNATSVIAGGKGDDAARRSSGESCSSRLVAPRSLNAPPVCRHSHFSQTRVPPTSLSINGVCSTSPAIRSRAATHVIARRPSARLLSR